jgi:hypothetical protein
MYIITVYLNPLFPELEERECTFSHESPEEAKKDVMRALQYGLCDTKEDNSVDTYYPAAIIQKITVTPGLPKE